MPEPKPIVELYTFYIKQPIDEQLRLVCPQFELFSHVFFPEIKERCWYHN